MKIGLWCWAWGIESTLHRSGHGAETIWSLRVSDRCDLWCLSAAGFENSVTTGNSSLKCCLLSKTMKRRLVCFLLKIFRILGTHSDTKSYWEIPNRMDRCGTIRLYFTLHILWQECFASTCVRELCSCLVPVKIRREPQIPWLWSYRELWAALTCGAGN